jgi:hypothetical protein
MIAVAQDWPGLGKYQGPWLSIQYHGRALPLGCWVLVKAFAVGSMTPVRELSMRTGHAFPPVRSADIALRGQGKDGVSRGDRLLAGAASWIPELHFRTRGGTCRTGSGFFFSFFFLFFLSDV